VLEENCLTNIQTWLIVGSDGMIGNALLQHLREQTDIKAIGTTRRAELTDDQIYLDLSTNLDRWALPDDIKVVINCAAIARLEACKRDPVGSHRINVDAVIELAKKCRDRNILFIHLSTDKVFSGKAPNMPPDAPFEPITVYGGQKAEAETSLLRMLNAGALIAIIRLTKVLTQDTALFHTWRDTLLKGDVIHPFADMTLAPIPLPFVVEVIKQVAIGHHTGVFQVSGEQDITYARVAARLAENLGVEKNLVQPIAAKHQGVFEEAISFYTSLDCTYTESTLDIQLPKVWDTVSWAMSSICV
jgi:dTDP-4-dehydrorhamnose reductase